MEHWKISNSQHQISGFQVSGVRFQVSPEDNQTEICWSEAEIPSEAKRKRETLKPPMCTFTGKAIEF
jgi:hypothetical protein